MAKNNGPVKLWRDVDITKDFDTAQDSAENVLIDEYNRANMTIFSANVNLARQLMRLSDSLKPVERRALFTAYSLGIRPGNKKKSIAMVGAVTEIHPHGGASVYASMINMGQYWKRQIPLLRFYGSIGTEVSEIYAADRYTEVSMSQYAWDCFFKDYDPECVQMIFNTSGSRMEPVYLPSRYPNVLINGGTGIAVGNFFRIPPFNIGDIIRETKKMLYKPSDAPVYMVPDLPTGCDIVDVDNSIKRICETGRGTLKMRAKIEIHDEGKYWGLQVTNIPWGVTQDTIHDQIVKLTKSGQLPIKEVQDRHEQLEFPDKTVVSHVDYWIIVDKAHDPYAVREKLYKKTKLEETATIDFKVVLEDLKVKQLSLRDLIHNWIEERREYKRRLINKRISKTTAQIELLKVMLQLTSGKNLEKTVGIIKDSDDNELAENLMREYGMSSYQAERIAAMRMGAFTKTARAKYEREIEEAKAELDRLYKLVRSEKMIDDIIAAELDELKKYETPRKSQVINPHTNQNMDTETEYFIIATKKGCLKKVSVDAVSRSKRGFGSFESGDYPTHILRAKNPDSILFVDSFGKYSVMPAAEIDTMAISDAPRKAFSILKLEGEIITMTYFQNAEALQWLQVNNLGTLSLVSISKNGFIKRCPMDNILTSTENGCKTVRNARLTKVRNNDAVAHVGYYLNDANIVIYTERGEYNYITSGDIPEFGHNAVGNRMINIEDGDACIGCCVVNSDAKFIVVVTDKGYAKKCEIAFLGIPSSSKSSTYLITVDPKDVVCYVDTPLKGIDVCTSQTHHEIDLEEIKTLGRKAKGIKKVPLQGGENIIRVITKN